MLPRGWSHASSEEMYELQQDALMVKRIQNRTRDSIVNSLENNLAAELSRRMAASVREEQDRIRVCDKSEELRALKQKLNEAKVSRERAAQLLEQQLREEEARFRDAMLDERLEEERLHIWEEEKAAQLRREHQRRLANAMQKDQIQERERINAENAREAIYEREQVDKLVEQLRAEDERAALERHERLMAQRRMFNEFAQQKDEVRREEQRRKQAELDEIEAFARNKREREARFEAEKQAIENEKKRRQNQLLEAHGERDRKAQELNYLKDELRLEEQVEKDRLKDLAAKEKALRDRVEMLRSYNAQLAEKEARKSQEHAEEMEFRKIQLARFAEEERIEQLTAERRRIKVKEHMAKVAELWQERKDAYEKEKALEFATREAEVMERERELAIIQQERERLLANAAKEGFRDFFVPGTLKDKSEAEKVDQIASDTRQNSNLRSIRTVLSRNTSPTKTSFY